MKRRGWWGIGCFIDDLSSRLRDPLSTRVPPDTARAVSGTGFSRESVRCRTASLMVFMMASSRLKPVPLIVRVHSVRWVLLNGGTRLSQRDWRRFNCGTGFSREGVGCHTAYLMVFIRASSRLKPVPLIDRVHSVRPIRPNCGSCAVSAICCGLNCGTGFSRESVRCHTASLMVFMMASSRLKPVPLIDRVRSVRLEQLNCETACIQSDRCSPIVGPYAASGTGCDLMVGPALTGKASCVTPHI